MVPAPTRPVSPTPSQMTTLCTLPSRILTARQNALDSAFYLGDDKMFNNVQWVRDGRAHRLVVKAGAADTNAQSGASNGQCPSPPPEEGFEFAPLCAIIRISDRDFWLTSDAGYRKDSQIWPELAKVKPSCALEAGDPQPLRDDFKKVLANIQKLQEMVLTPGYQAGKGFILPGGITGTRLKSLESEQDDKTANEEDRADTGAVKESEEESAFLIENWPLTDENARDELLSLKETHRLVPIPAYNLQGKLIKPDAYRRCLEDALVEICFDLSHWAIAGKKGGVGTDVFTADISMIRVIAPPQVAPKATPRKRKISLYVDPAASPSKKRHLD